MDSVEAEKAKEPSVAPPPSESINKSKSISPAPGSARPPAAAPAPAVSAPSTTPATSKPPPPPPATRAPTASPPASSTMANSSSVNRPASQSPSAASTAANAPVSAPTSASGPRPPPLSPPVPSNGIKPEGGRHSFSSNSSISNAAPNADSASANAARAASTGRDDTSRSSNAANTHTNANATVPAEAAAMPAAAAAEPTPLKPINGNGQKSGSPEGEVESELSEPASTIQSPSGVDFRELEDEIVVGSRSNGARRSLPTRAPVEKEDQIMTDAPAETSASSHYPKRKRTSVFNDLSESKIENGTATQEYRAPSNTVKPKGPRQSLGSVKGVVVGHWRDSPAPDDKIKHAVIGFIDVRDRLRTRIQAFATNNEPVPSEYPLPPGPGGSWVTFERIAFLPHLVGLDHFAVKEFVRIRSDAVPEDTEAARKAAEKEAVNEAVRRVKENPNIEASYSNNNNPPLIAYGPEIPAGVNGPPAKPEPKRRKVSGGFSSVNPTPAPTNGATQEPAPVTHHQPIAALPSPHRAHMDPLHGTRPTRILLGHWKLSSESIPRDRHAVYGILGQNDMFRVKLVRETRDGRFVDGNFPMGAGALWIAYEEVEFENHLKPLTRHEIKEYCRVRQWQIDHGEAPEERMANEAKAVSEAQVRVNHAMKGISPPITSFSSIITDHEDLTEPIGPRGTIPAPELRQSRRVEARAERPIRQAPPEPESRPTTNRGQGPDPVERTNTLARREIARAEAAQGRADRHAANRERAAAAAAASAAAAAAAAATDAPVTNGRSRLHESDEMQRLNKVWARQETLRMKAGSDDAKIYDGVKYERKSNGPFMGKLVSQGTIISIDGEDFVEYRVLTKPSFF